MDDFLWRALLGGLGVAFVAGPLGAFVVWRRMAFFGDTVAHSALLGVALAFALGLNLNLGIAGVALAVALLLVVAQRQHRLANDTLLGILSHGTLAIGLVVVAFQSRLRVDLMAYLFGDILAVSRNDLYWIYGGGVAILALLAVIWRPLLAMTVHEEMARVDGVPVSLVRLVFMLLIALVVAGALKIVGILLITALLVIPAATARRLSRTPEQMAVMASLFGCASVSGGLWGSYRWDLPTGPSVVVAALALFIAVAFFPHRAGQRGGG